MSEQRKKQAKNNAAYFRLQKLYVKDLSFENPNAPEIFLETQEPNMEVNLRLKNKKLENDLWEVSLLITATMKNSESDKTIFIAEIEHCGVFILKNIPEKQREMVLAVDAPTMMFPFTRQIISQGAVDGGFAPFLMEPVNFAYLFQNAKKKKLDPTNI